MEDPVIHAIQCGLHTSIDDINGMGGCLYRPAAEGAHYGRAVRIAMDAYDHYQDVLQQARSAGEAPW